MPVTINLFPGVGGKRIDSIVCTVPIIVGIRVVGLTIAVGVGTTIVERKCTAATIVAGVAVVYDIATRGAGTGVQLLRIACRKKRRAAFLSRLAVSRKSIMSPSLSTAR
jgi:hypothetical protein